MNINVNISTCLLGEPSPPSIHGQPGSGKSFKLSITKQDDGGAPILEYIVKYRSVSMSPIFNLAKHLVKICWLKPGNPNATREKTYLKVCNKNRILRVDFIYLGLNPTELTGLLNRYI